MNHPADGDDLGTPLPAEEATVLDEHPLVNELMLHPYRWRIWPAVAVLRWLQGLLPNAPRLVFRSHPSLSFAGSEVHDLTIDDNRIGLVLNTPGLATDGSPLPASDIARIIADRHEGGALSAWLDGPGDRFMHLLEEAQRRSNAAFALVAGGGVEALALTRDLVGRSAPLNAGPDRSLGTADDADPEGAVGLAGLFSRTRLGDRFGGPVHGPSPVYQYASPSSQAQRSRPRTRHSWVDPWS